MPLGRARLMESSLSESSTAWLWWKMASESESMCRVSGPAMVSVAARESRGVMESPAAVASGMATALCGVVFLSKLER